MSCGKPPVDSAEERRECCAAHERTCIDDDGAKRPTDLAAEILLDGLDHHALGLMSN